MNQIMYVIIPALALFCSNIWEITFQSNVGLSPTIWTLKEELNWTSLIHVVVFWVMILCSNVVGFHRFGWPCCFPRLRTLVFYLSVTTQRSAAWIFITMKTRSLTSVQINLPLKFSSVFRNSHSSLMLDWVQQFRFQTK